MSQYYNNFMSLYDSEMFKQDEKHNGKEQIGRAQILYMLSRTQSMFKWENLPETIPQRNLEMMLQINGNVFFSKVNGEYYVFTGGLGGEPDVYYEPTEYVIANPALDYSKNLKIDTDGILMRSDSYGVGLLPMMQKYAHLMVENEFTMRIADINARIPFLLAATDDKTYKSALLFLERVADGSLGVISDDAFYESLKSLPAGNSNNTRLTDLIEYQQYLKAAWFNELGLNANYNMKREAVSAGEAQLNDDALLPFVDDMLKARKTGIEKINEMYGLDISVELDSSWMKEQIEQIEMLSPEEYETAGDIIPQNDDPAISGSDELATASDPEPKEDETEETEEVKDDLEVEEISEEVEDPEKIMEEMKEVIEDLKEDIEDIKEEVTEESDDDNTETE